jgi:hypothetical protein
VSDTQVDMTPVYLLKDEGSLAIFARKMSPFYG